MKTQKSYADDIRQIIERTKHKDDEWEVKLRAYDTGSYVEIRNLSDRGTWFTRQLLAISQYAEAFNLTFWIQSDCIDSETGGTAVVGTMALPQTEKQKEAAKKR